MNDPKEPQPGDIEPSEDPLGDIDAEFRQIMEAENLVPQGRCIAVILSPVDSAAALSAALNMVGASAEVVPASRGSAVYMDVPQEGAEDDEEASMAALLGDDRPLPKQVVKMAELVSKLAKGGAVALTSWTSDSDAGLVGNIVARRFVNGKAEESLPSGLVLAHLDLGIEDLLLGRLTPAEVKDSYGKGRWTGWLRGPGFRG